MLELIHILTGGDPPPSMDLLIKLYVEKMKLDLENAIWRAGSYFECDVTEVVSAYESLHEAARVHLLLSPAIYEYLDAFRGVSSFDGGLEAWNRVEQLVFDQQSIVNSTPSATRKNAKSVWSPIGDVGLYESNGSWLRRDASKLSSIVTLDFDSEYATVVRSESTTMRNPPEEFTSEERALVLDKCNQAIEYIERVSPSFARLINNYTRAVRFRKANQVPGLSSEHVTSTIGEIRLLNVHRPGVHFSKLVEFLIHESVHNLLSTYEYTYGVFLPLGDAKQQRPVSPWSGNPLPVASFTHAIFVWFALFNFAVLETQQPSLSPQERQQAFERRNHNAAGFVGPVRLRDNLRSASPLNPAVLHAIDLVQDTVLERFEKTVQARAVA